MDKNKLPIKYQIGIWKTLPNYPTREDVLYELTAYVAKMKGDEFSEQTFNGIWCDATGVANWKGTAYEKHLNAMIADPKYFELTRTEEKTGKKWYKIVYQLWD